MLLLIGISIWTLPAILIALSSRYQKELKFGIGYLPVYIQCFGLMMMGYAIYCMLSNKSYKLKIGKLTSRIIRFLAYGMVIIILLLNQQNARIYIEQSNHVWLYPRKTLESALEVALFDDVEDGALIVTKESPWGAGGVLEGDIFYEALDKKINVISEMNFNQNIDVILEQLKKGEIDNIYIVYHWWAGEYGVLAKARLREVKILEEQVVEFVNSVEIYTKANERKDFVIYYDSLNSIGEPTEKHIDVFTNDKAKSKHWDTTYKINPSYILNFANIHIMDKNEYLTFDQYFILGDGFYGIEGESYNSWIWSNKKSELFLINNTPSTLTYNLSARILSQDVKPFNLKIDSMGEYEEIQVDQKGIEWTRKITIGPGIQKVTFESEGEPINAPGDPRELFWKLMNFECNIE